MAINVNEAHGLEEFGVVFTDDDGNVQLYITSGSGSPVGQAAPVPTLYINKTDQQMWRKTGPANNEWTRLEWDKNFSLCKITEDTTIPDGQELLATAIQIEPTGCLNVTQDSGVTIIRG